MAGENFQIYTVQITGKCICETFPPSLYDLIIGPHVKKSPINLPKNVCSPMENFFKRKKSSHALGGRKHYALSLYLLPPLKASLISVVQIMAFQSKTTYPLCF